MAKRYPIKIDWSLSFIKLIILLKRLIKIKKLKKNFKQPTQGKLVLGR